MITKNTMTHTRPICWMVGSRGSAPSAQTITPAMTISRMNQMRQVSIGVRWWNELFSWLRDRLYLHPPSITRNAAICFAGADETFFSIKEGTKMGFR